MVCSKSEGGEISGRSLSRSFFLPPFSAPEKIEMILLRGFLSSGTEGSGLELWLAESESLLEPVLKMVLLILTGGAGGLSSGSPLSHIALGRCEPYRVSERGRGSTAREDGEGDKQRGEQDSAHISKRHGCAHALQEEVQKVMAEEKVPVKLEHSWT